MEKVSSIISNYGQQKYKNTSLEAIKKVFIAKKIPHQSLKLQNTTLVIFVDNHITATEVKYKQRYIIKLLKPYNALSISVRSKD